MIVDHENSLLGILAQSLRKIQKLLKKTENFRLLQVFKNLIV